MLGKQISNIMNREPLPQEGTKILAKLVELIHQVKMGQIRQLHINHNLNSTNRIYKIEHKYT